LANNKKWQTDRRKRQDENNINRTMSNIVSFIFAACVLWSLFIIGYKLSEARNATDVAKKSPDTAV